MNHLTAIASMIFLQLANFPEGPLTLPQVSDTQGKAVAFSATKPTILFFLTCDCPISNRLSPEIAAIAKEYAKRGVTAYAVYTDPSFSPADCAKHTAQYKLGMRAVLDARHALVKATGATVTPEAAVIGPKANLLYRGRIDDSYSDHGRRKQGPFRRDLRIALDEALKGKPVSIRQTAPIGCYISTEDQAPSPVLVRK
jgi:hypothetical protein